MAAKRKSTAKSGTGTAAARYRIHVILAAVIGGVLATLFWNVHLGEAYLEVNLKVEEPGVVQFFRDIGNGFNEDDSDRFEMSEADVFVSKKIAWDAQWVENIQTLRFDPINNEGTIWLKELSFKRSGDLSPKSFLQEEYSPSSGIDRWQWNAKDRMLPIYPEVGNGDPHFLISEIPAFLETPEGALNLPLLVISAVLVFAAVSFFVGALTLPATEFVLSGFTWIRELWTSAIRSYSQWIDRVGEKWDLVCPTSCVVFGAAVAVISFFAVKSSDWFQERTSTSDWRFEIELGDNADSLHIYYWGEEGLNAQRSRYFHLEKTPGGQTVRYPIQDLPKKILGMRIDPAEGPKSVEIRSLNLIRPDGHRIPISLTGWDTNRDIASVSHSGYGVQIEAIGADPYLRNNELGIYTKVPKSAPFEWMFPIVIGIWVSTVFLLYNRLITEDMPISEIRRIQNL